MTTFAYHRNTPYWLFTSNILYCS